MRLVAIDYVVLAAYFLIVFAIGFYHSRRGRTSTEYFLAGRDVAWWAIGASLFSSNIGSEHFIGLAGTGAASGMAVGHFEWLASFMVLMLGWVFVPFYLRSNVYTMPEFLATTAHVALTWRASRSSPTSSPRSVAIFAGAIVLKIVLGWNMWQSTLAIVLATGVYTVGGGLAAVIYTEVMQTVILVAGALLLAIIGLNEVGGWQGLRASVPPEFFHMMKPSTDAAFPWTGIFFGAPILGIWYWCTDQVIVQRVLSAKDIGHARVGTVVAGFLKILPVFMLVVPGMIARALYPEVASDTNSAFPILITKLLPAGFQGIMIAAMLAALMSSLSAVFNSSSTIFTMDFYRKFEPEASERELVRVGRVATVVMVLLGLTWIPFMSRISSELWLYLQSVQAYISPPITAVFLLGVFWRRINGEGAIAALGTGFVLGAVRFVLEVSYAGTKPEGLLGWYIGINFLHFAILVFAICVAVLVAVSLATKAPAEAKVAGLTWQTAQAAMLPGDETSPAILTIVGEESLRQRRVNGFFAALLIFTIISLWVWFA